MSYEGEIWDSTWCSRHNDRDNGRCMQRRERNRPADLWLGTDYLSRAFDPWYVVALTIPMALDRNRILTYGPSLVRDRVAMSSNDLLSDLTYPSCGSEAIEFSSEQGCPMSAFTVEPCSIANTLAEESDSAILRN